MACRPALETLAQQRRAGRLKIAAVAPESQPPGPAHRHRQQVVQQLVFLRDDHQVGAGNGIGQVLPAQALIHPVAARHRQRPGQVPAVVLGNFTGRGVTMNQNEIDAALAQVVAQLLEQPDPVMRQPALHAHHPRARTKGGCRRAGPLAGMGL